MSDLLEFPRTTITGDDEGHELSKEEKDKLERDLRQQARNARSEGNPREANRKNQRATNISRRASRGAQHH